MGEHGRLGSYPFGEFYLPCSPIHGQTDKWPVAKMMVAKMFEAAIESFEAEGEVEAPLESAFNTSIISRIQESRQARATG